jgi:nucleoid-associated protein YgaU
MTATIRFDTFDRSSSLSVRPAMRSRTPSPAVFLRRRAVVLAVVLAITGGAVQVADTLGGGGIERVAVSTYVVRPGDTLWGIAGQLAPERDRRDVIDELRRANGDLIDPTRLTAGQAITVPGDLVGTR